MIATVFSHGTGIAVAEPAGPESLSGMVAAVADADQKLQDLGAAIQAEQEGVNQALVGVQTARDQAATAQRQVDESHTALQDADRRITEAQKRFDQFAASTYVNGPSSSYLTAGDPADVLGTVAAGQTLAVSSQQAVDDLMRARTEQVNRESAARLAKQKADQAVADAQASQDSAVASLTAAQQTFKQQQVDLDRLTAERSRAQAELAAARPQPAPAAAAPT
ncbi:coiled-coil domain-containing protein, partial [Mycolicibacterium grossiae]